MKKMTRSMITVILSVVAITASFAESTQAVDFKALLVTIDQRSNFSSVDMSAKARVVSDEPGKATDTRVLLTFRRDRESKFLMAMLQPQSILGQGYLRTDNNLWFYDPESREFTHTSMKENFQGTSAKNSDFSNSTLAVDYRVGATSEGKLGVHDVWILELQASNNEVTYPFKKIWVSKKDSLLLKSEDYSLAKRLLRTAYYTSYAQVGSTFVCNKEAFIDALIAGKKTTLELSDISLAPVPDTVFTKVYLERINH